MKKISKVLLFLFIFIFAFASCSQNETGEIEIIEDKPIVISDSVGNPLFESKEKPNIEFAELNDAYAGFSIEYPADWSPIITSSNFMQFQTDYATITLHHKPSNNSGDWEDDAQTIFNNFDKMAESEVFDVYQYSKMQRRIRQSITTTSIESDDPFLMSKEFDNIKLMNDYGDFVAGKLYEKRYMLQYNDFDTVIGIISTQEKKDDAAQIIDYMIGTIKPAKIAYDNSKSVSVFDKDLIVPPVFEQKEVEINDQHATIYYDETFGDAFNGFFIAKTPAPKTLEYDFLEQLFESSVSGVTSCNFNDTDASLFNLSENKLSYSCTVGDTINNLQVSNGTVWTVEIYNDESELVILGYPKAKTEIVKKLIALQ